MTLTYDDILKELNEQSLLLHVRSPLRQERSFRVDAYDSEATHESCFIFFKAVKRSSKERLGAILLSGASFFLVEEKSLLEEIPQDKIVFLVRSCREAWAYLAAKSFNYPQKSLKLIAITGTNGKTSTAWILPQILQSQGYKSGYIGTLGSSITPTLSFPHTTPDPPVLFALLDEAKKQGYHSLAIEVSSHSLSQKKMCPLRFDAAVFTSFSRDHLDFHNSMDEYLKTKLSLFSEAYLRKEAPIFMASQVRPFLTKEIIQELSPVFYGEGEPKTDTVAFQTTKEDLSGFELSFQDSDKTLSRGAPFVGSKNKENFFVSLLLAKSLLAKWPEFPAETLKQLPARLERLPLEHTKAPLIFIDYAHTPEALRDTLNDLRRLDSQKKLYVLFGCGGDRDPGKRAIMGTYAENCADHVTITSDNPRGESPEKIIQDILSGVKKPASTLVIKDREKAIQATLEKLDEGDCLLLAGKGHENYLETEGKKHPFSEKEIVLNFYKEKKL